MAGSAQVWLRGEQRLDSKVALTNLRLWFESPLGAHVLAAEQAILAQVLPGCFGYDLLQLSVQNTPLYAASPIHNKLAMGVGGGDAGAFIGKATSLPFETGSMDVVLLHHMLEFYDSPQQILREVGRIALPSGHVVIVGFNPMSLWGLYRPVGKMRKMAPWFGSFIGPGRLMDWLTLLDFQIDRAQYMTYGLPLEGYNGAISDYSQGLSRNANWPFGAVYVIVARKQVGSITPIKPLWQRQRAFGRLSLVRPAVNQGLTQNGLSQEGVSRRDGAPDKPE